MRDEIITIKQRIEKNYKKLQRKYQLTNIVLKEIDRLISFSASNDTVSQWLKKHDNIIFCLEYNLKNLEN